MYNTLIDYADTMKYFPYFSRKFRLMRRVFYSLLLLLTTIYVTAQESSENGALMPQFSFHYLHGNVWKAKDIDKNNSNYIQLSANLKTGTQDESFFKWYGCPNVGFTGLYGYLGTSDVLGSVFAIYPTWNYSFFDDKTIGMNVKLGTGFAWFNRPFDKIENPENKLIGSHASNITELSLGAWFEIAPQWRLEAAASFLHFSNGHTSIPNVGLNDMTAKIGVTYKPGAMTNMRLPRRRLPEKDTTLKRTISLSLGRHELAMSEYPADGPNYSVYKLYVGVAKRLSNINELQIGLSSTYYEGFHTFIHLTDYYEHLQRLRSTVWTVHVGHEFLINRFGFVTDLGIKVLDPFYRDYFLDNDWKSQWHKALFAPKLGFKFYPIWNSFAKQKLALGMYIKTNGGQADFVEYSLSYTF